VFDSQEKTVFVLCTLRSKGYRLIEGLTLRSRKNNSVRTVARQRGAV